MAVLLFAHFLAAALAPGLVRLFGRRTFLLLALVPAASFGWLLTRMGEVTGETAHQLTETISWVPAIHLDIALRLDTLSWTLAMLVTGVGALVLVYCGWYFEDGDPSLWRFTGAFTAFAGSMLGLVLARNLLLIYVFWELTTVFSFVLIGHNPERRANRRAAVNALIVTTFGGLAMLVGFVMLGEAAGSLPDRRGGGGARPPAGERRRHRGHRAGPGRCDLQVRPGAVPLLVARRDGRAHPGQRLPARRGDGQGRHLPRLGARARVRRHRPVADHPDRARACSAC